MNIVLVSGGWIKVPSEEGGGAEAYIFNLSKQLVKTGHDVTILDREYSLDGPDVEYIDDVKIVRLESRKFTRFNFTINFVLSQVAFAFAVKRYLGRASKADVIHLCHSVLALVIAVTSKDMRRKLVYGSQGFRRAKDSLSLTDRMALALENQVVKRVRKTTIANEIIAAKLTRQAKVRAQNVSLVPIGVDVEKFNPDLDVSELRQRYNFEGKATVLFVGRLSEEKGVEYLVRAANILVNEFGNRSVQFLLVGPAEQFDLGTKSNSHYMAKITKLISDCGLEQEVIMTGAVPIDDLRGLYAACDMVVVPSIVDLDPQVQIEAMASGKPVIGTRVGTMPRRIRDEQSGFIIDPANERQLAEKIRYLIDNPAEAKRMGAFARKLVLEEFASYKMAEQMLKVFEEVVSPSQ